MDSVLVIDDDANMRESLSEILELEGFDCQTAASAKEGLELCARIKPAALITDLQLPDSSGFQICAAARAMSPEMAIIMMTGKSLTPQEKEQGLKLGADEYLAKPFDIKDLSGRIKRLLVRRTVK
jgi:DNA-binding response OmpR family regulator